MFPILKKQQNGVSNDFPYSRVYEVLACMGEFLHDVFARIRVVNAALIFVNVEFGERLVHLMVDGCTNPVTTA